MFSPLSVSQEQYVFIHDAILEACLCGETAIPVNEFALTYKEMLKVDSQSNTSQLREEFQVIHKTHTHSLTYSSNHKATLVLVVSSPQLRFSYMATLLYPSTVCNVHLVASLVDRPS